MKTWRLRLLADLTSLWREEKGRNLPEVPPAEVQSKQGFVAANAQDAMRAKQSLKAFNVSECLGEQSRKTKRNLLAYASLAAIVALYNIKITRLPWVEVDLPEKLPALLGLVLFVLVGYCFVGYLLYAGADILGWRHKFERGYFEAAFQFLYRLDKNFETIEANLTAAKQSGTLTKNIEDVLRQGTVDAQNTLDQLVGFYDRLRDETRLRVLLVYGWELIVPSIVGGAGLWFTARPAYDALSVLWQ